MEVEKRAAKDKNHKEKFEDDRDFKEMLSKMSNVLSAIELSTKKEKTRKIFEDNLKNMIDVSDRIVMSKCTEIWALYDEIQEEMRGTMYGIWVSKQTKQI